VKKTTTAALCGAILALAALAVHAANSLVEVQSTQTTAPIAGAGEISHVEIIGAVPATGTALVYRVVGVHTQAITGVLTCSGGHNSSTLSNRYVVAGDDLYWSGSITNTPTVKVRLILTE